MKKLRRYRLQRGIQYLLAHVKKPLNIGVVVQSMRNNKVLFQHRSHDLFAPASVMKLFTASAAAHYLKGNFTFKTKLETDGKIRGHTLHGNLIIKFSGDPTLTNQNLSDLIAALKLEGIHRIRGHVYLDNHDYGTVPYPPGWIWDDLSYSFAAPMSAIIIDQNKFTLRFVPKGFDKRPQLIPLLPKGVVHIENEALTKRRHIQGCPITVYSSYENRYRVGGCLNGRWGTQQRSLAIRNVYSYAEALIRQDLKNNGIKLSRSIEIRHEYRRVKTLVTHTSKPLYKILHTMLKDSNNLYTNALLKKIGEKYYHSRGTWQNSLVALKKLLTKPTGIDFTHNLINDGAGLSRYNLVSPEQVNRVLRFIYLNKRVHQIIYPALPIAGRDGTLADRMLSEGRSQRVHAKTGTMTGVTALAGYLDTKHNGVLSFVILINDFVGPRKPYIRLEDHICQFLINARR